MNFGEISQIIDKFSVSKGGLIAILDGIQSRYGYLPQDALKFVSQKMDIPLVNLYSVATFYRAFTLEPRGRHLVRVCMGTACHVRGAPQIVEEFERHLNIKAGATTSDGEFTLETVNCLGACALGPIVVVDGHYFSNVKTASVRKLLRKAREGIDKIEVKTDKRIFPIDVSCPNCNRLLMDPTYYIDDHPSIKVTVSFGRKHGWLRLSSLYGSYNISSEHEIPMDKVVNFFCPHCNVELKSPIDCVNCGAPMIPMLVRGGGMVHICSRRGCKEHILDLEGSSL